MIWLQFLSPSLTGSNPDWLAGGEDGPGASGQNSRLDSTRSQGDSKRCRGDWRILSYRGGCTLQAEGLSVSPVSHTPAVPCLSPKSGNLFKNVFFLKCKIKNKEIRLFQQTLGNFGKVPNDSVQPIECIEYAFLLIYN